MAIEIKNDNSPYPHTQAETLGRINSLYELARGEFVTLCRTNGDSQVERSTLIVASEVMYESGIGSYVMGRQFLPSAIDKGKCICERPIYWGDYWQSGNGRWLEKSTPVDILKFKLNL